MTRGLAAGMIMAQVTVIALGAAPARATDFAVGDVFVGVGYYTTEGTYRRYTSSGVFIEALDTGYIGYATGCALDGSLNLYGTNLTANHLIKFNRVQPHGKLLDIDTPGVSGRADKSIESVVLDNGGLLYAGHAGQNATGTEVHRYTQSGALLDEYTVSTTSVGSDWLDLAVDQCTLFYTSEGTQILRYDVCARTQLTNFADLPANGEAFALRLLPPGDGSGGLLVADRGDIKRLDGAGKVVQTYGAPGENHWFALNLDVNTSSFWSGNDATGNIYRFNIQSGQIELGPITVAGTMRMYGMCVAGEPTAGSCPSAPVARAAAPAAVCLGSSATIDASGSTACNATGLIYRWLDQATEVCGWSPAPACTVSPTATTTYTVEVACADKLTCTASAPVNVTVRNCTLAVHWERMDAVRATGGAGAEVTWTTVDESETIGFQVERGASRTGPFAPVGTPIAATGGGSSYRLRDGNTSPGAPPWYRIVELLPGREGDVSEPFPARGPGVGRRGDEGGTARQRPAARRR